MGEAKKEDEKEEQLIPVGPGADDLPEKAEKGESEDKRLAQTDDEDSEDEKPERRKESSKERRERAKKAHARDRAELEYWRKRGEALEKRFATDIAAMENRQAQTETAAIDQRINTLNGQLATARRVISEAAAKPNGAGAAEHEEALKIYDELRDQLSELKTSKKQQLQRAQERQQAPQREVEQAKPDPRVVRNARDWASKHDWFSFDGEDEDSRIVRAIDESLAADGFDPMEDDYWEELTARVRRRLPERFKKGAAKSRPDEDEEMDDDEDEREVRGSGPKFSSGGRERPLRKGEVYVSAERKQAMKEYGVWDDPVARNRMLKKYAQWDAEIAASKR